MGTDVICHSFANDQCGGLKRRHSQWNCWIEYDIDGWLYDCTRTGVRHKYD